MMVSLERRLIFESFRGLGVAAFLRVWLRLLMLMKLFWEGFLFLKTEIEGRRFGLEFMGLIVLMLNKSRGAAFRSPRDA